MHVYIYIRIYVCTHVYHLFHAWYLQYSIFKFHNHCYILWHYTGLKATFLYNNNPFRSKHLLKYQLGIWESPFELTQLILQTQLPWLVQTKKVKISSITYYITTNTYWCKKWKLLLNLFLRKMKFCRGGLGKLGKIGLSTTTFF